MKSKNLSFILILAYCMSGFSEGSLRTTFNVPSSCDYSDWYTEPGCSSCVAAVQIIEYNGTEYVAYFGDNSTCSDAITTIYNCDGTVHCYEGGFVGNTQCTDNGLLGGYSVVSTLWSKFDCSYTDPICGSCIASVQIINYNGIEYVAYWGNSNNCSDAISTVYNYDGTVYCYEGGLVGNTQCSGNGLLGGYSVVSTIWSTFDCSYTDPVCGSCTASIQVIKYNGIEYIAYWGDNNNCSDAITTVYNYDGTVYCYEGGLVGNTQCSDNGLLGSYSVVSTLWSNFECSYTDPVCGSCIASVQIINYNGQEYIAYWGANNTCSDAISTVYNYDGSVYCYEGGFVGNTQCTDNGLIGGYSVVSTLWSNFECSYTVPDCSSCISSVQVINYNGIEYIAYWGDNNTCSDAISTVYKYDGTVYCYEGGFVGNTQCTDNGLLGAYSVVSTLWSKFDCSYSDPDCSSCISSVQIINYNGIEYVAYWGDNNTCSDAISTVYNYDGTVYCNEGGLAGNTQCTDNGLIGGYSVVNTLWSNFECSYTVPDCSGCIASVQVINYNGIEYIAYWGDSNTCSDAISTVYKNDGTVYCYEGGLVGNTQCTDNGLLGGYSVVSTLWSKFDCSYTEPNCNGCIGSVQIIKYNGIEYIAYWGDNTCSDAISIVYNYDGSVYCYEGGFVGYLECSNNGLLGGYSVVSTLWSKFDCSYTDPDCNSCIASVEVIKYNGIEYIAYWGDNNTCSDAISTVYNYDGSVYCYEGGLVGNTQCTDNGLLAGYTVVNTIWSKLDCWYNEPSCGSCFESVQLIESNGMEYIAFWADKTNCLDAISIVYYPNGNLFCLEDGLAGYTQCSDNGLLSNYNVLNTLWTKMNCGGTCPQQISYSTPVPGGTMAYAEKSIIINGTSVGNGSGSVSLTAGSEIIILPGSELSPASNSNILLQIGSCNQ